jgi:hypothetical protein
MPNATVAGMAEAKLPHADGSALGSYPNPPSRCVKPNVERLFSWKVNPIDIPDGTSRLINRLIGG